MKYRVVHSLIVLILGMMVQVSGQNNPGSTTGQDIPKGSESTSPSVVPQTLHAFIRGGVLQWVEKSPEPACVTLCLIPLKSLKTERRVLPLSVPRNGMLPKYKIFENHLVAIAVSDFTGPGTYFSLSKIPLKVLVSVEDYERKTPPSLRNIGLFSDPKYRVAGISPLALVYNLHPGIEDDLYGTPDDFIHYDFFQDADGVVHFVMITLKKATIWRLNQKRWDKSQEWEKSDEFPTDVKGDFSIFVKDKQPLLLFENGQLYELAHKGLKSIGTVFVSDTNRRFIIHDQDSSKTYLIEIDETQPRHPIRAAHLVSEVGIVKTGLPVSLGKALDIAFDPDKKGSVPVK
jgi:hypothetical protein